MSSTMKVQTYIFLDLETTGLPTQENNRTKITEISLVAVKREHLLMAKNEVPSQPRVQNKLTLCLNPGKLISPESTEITGLCNFLLEKESYFNNQVFETINVFISIMSKPVCIIAHNGNYFDFPILKAHFVKLEKSLSDDIFCADSLNAFKSLIEQREHNNLESFVASDVEATVINKDETCCSPLSAGSTQMKNINESTPQKKKQMNNPYTPKKPFKRTLEGSQHREYKFPKSNRRLFGVEQPKKKSYKLEDVYKSFFNTIPVNGHRAEADCITNLECSVNLSEKFVDWVDQNCKPFADVKPMTLGLRNGQ